MRRYQRQTSVDCDQISPNWMLLFNWSESEWFCPFHSPHSSIGHLQPHHWWDICCRRRLMYQYFQYVALEESSVIPYLLLGTFRWKGLKLNNKCYRTVDRCISTALASRLSVSMLSFGGRRDVKTSHRKGQDSTMDGKVREPWIIPPCQIQSCCLTGTLQVYYGYKCTWGRCVKQIICVRKQRVKPTRRDSCNPAAILVTWP